MRYIIKRTIHHNGLEWEAVRQPCMNMKWPERSSLSLHWCVGWIRVSPGDDANGVMTHSAVISVATDRSWDMSVSHHLFWCDSSAVL